MAIESFTTYTEVDPNSRITVTASKITATNLRGNEDAYVYKDMGANYFGGDFQFVFTVNATAVFGSGNYIFLVSLTNIIDDMYGIVQADGSALAFQMLFSSTGGYVRFYLREVDSGTIYTSTYYTPTQGVNYYVKVVRYEGIGTYGTLYAYIYSDSGLTNLLATLSLVLHTSKKDFRYVYGLQAHNWSLGAYDTASIENLTTTLLTVTENNYPIDPITRVTALVHRYDNFAGIYQLEISLGDVTSVFAHSYELGARRATASKELVQETGRIFDVAKDERLLRKIPPEFIETVVDTNGRDVTKLWKDFWSANYQQVEKMVSDYFKRVTGGAGEKIK